MYILMFSSVVTLVSTVLQLTLDYRRDVGGIRKQLEQIRVSYLQSLASSLWVSSKKDVRLQLEGILRLPDMQYLEVFPISMTWRWPLARKKTARSSVMNLTCITRIVATLSTWENCTLSPVSMVFTSGWRIRSWLSWSVRR